MFAPQIEDACSFRTQQPFVAVGGEKVHGGPPHVQGQDAQTLDGVEEQISTPTVRDFGQAIGIAGASSESALAAGLVMGVMIIPFVSSMADDSIAAVPQAMRDGSLAMGATTSETIRKVLIPAALPGIVAGVMLAVSRAIGETMIVVMAAGAAARLTANPFESMTTVTFQIVAMLTGEGSFDHPATLSAFALGMVLFVVTLTLNFIALRVVKRYREAYE